MCHILVHLNVHPVFLGSELSSLFPKAVGMTEATSTQYQELKKQWIESKPAEAIADKIKAVPKATALQIADVVAERLADHLLDAWARC
jgi:hypothetical protein